MIVLDASALVDAVIGQPTRGWVLEQVRGQQVVAPAHQPAEVVSAIARLVRSGALTSHDGHAAVRDADALAQELVLPAPGHLARALDMQDRVRVLDALYVVVAQDREVALVTTDRRLARSVDVIDVRCPGE